MYYCNDCDKTFTENEANTREEDNTFSAPFGELKVVIGGYIDTIFICPECGEDLEVVE